MVEIRKATVADADVATALARAAKASWGYREAWLREWEPELEISPEYVRQNAVFVAESEGEVVGVIGIGQGAEGPEIGHLWVAPAAQRMGVGRALIAQAHEVGAERGWTSFRIVSDPFAEAFYVRLGAVRIGKIAAPVMGTHRELPLLELPVAG